MTNFSEFLALLQAGHKPVVTFKKRIEDQEAYPEKGMRARALSAGAPDSDDVVGILFQFDEFDAFNIPLESTSYYDKHGKPTLTARQANFYKPTECLYFDVTGDPAEFFEVVQDCSLALFTEFTASGVTGSYVEWLEQQLMVARAG